MKILIFSMLILLSSCSGDNTDKQETPIIGTWQLIELWFPYNGLTPEWKAVENGYTYTFKSNSVLTSNRFSECSGVSYSVSEDKLTLNYKCNDFYTGIEETRPSIFIENYTLEGEYLMLIPTYLSCAEGCVYKFKRISKE